MNTITVNDKEHSIPDNLLEISLLTYLREHLHLTGTKNGCEKGLCGSCTVIADGSAVRSCKIPLKRALGKRIITIEGLQDPKTKTLHPIQQSFVDAGAIQCGFCTPGMVMSSYGLLLKNPAPSREQIKKALKGNLCRCTGYQQIFDAVELAARRISDSGMILKK